MTGPVLISCLIGSVLCIAFVFNTRRHRRFRNGLPLPPGPVGLPLVGSIFELNSVHPWLSYEQWGKKYGAVVYANLLGLDFIIISSAKAAHDLFERRSAIYSDRPCTPANDLFGIDFNSGFLPYGDKWRLHRKVYNGAFNKQKASRYRPLTIRKVHQLVEHLLDTPEKYAEHCQTFAAAVILAATHGYEVAPSNDPFVTKIEHFLKLFLTAVTPERSALLLAFPFMSHIPSWLPGGRYKQRAAECRVLAKEVLNGPIQHVMKDMAAGLAEESLVRDWLEQQDSRVDEYTIKAVTTTAFVAGAETTDETLQIFLLAMVLHPEVQAKAQEEIDRVIGSGRLPDFDDRPNLPYIQAVYLETLRWRPVLPTALPHMTTTSDVYEGMYIPKGAVVLANIWGIGHEETQFKNSMAFTPERYLPPSGTLTEDAAHYAFGFGRRICPGRYIADQSVWAAIATILATTHIVKARNELGQEIDVKAEFKSGITSGPKPFMFSITPRSSSIAKLIRRRNDIGY